MKYMKKKKNIFITQHMGRNSVKSYTYIIYLSKTKSKHITIVNW